MQLLLDACLHEQWCALGVRLLQMCAEYEELGECCEWLGCTLVASESAESRVADMGQHFTESMLIHVLLCSMLAGPANGQSSLPQPCLQTTTAAHAATARCAAADCAYRV